MAVLSVWHTLIVLHVIHTSCLYCDCLIKAVKRSINYTITDSNPVVVPVCHSTPTIPPGCQQAPQTPTTLPTREEAPRTQAVGLVHESPGQDPMHGTYLIF